MDVLCKFSLPSLTGVPADDCTGDLVFSRDGVPTEEQLATLAALIGLFFNTAQATTFSIATYISNDISRAADACEVAIYDLTGHLDGSDVGSPIQVEQFTLGAALAASTPLPQEVACCMSYNASLVGVPEIDGVTRPRARRRGRLFIGPVNNAANSTDNPSRSRPSALFMNTVLQAADEQLASDGVGSGWGWRQWSRVEATIRNVVNVSIDNAWDTIRSRGVGPTFRSNVLVDTIV